MTAPASTGCTLCVFRVTGAGMPSYCADFTDSANHGPGRLIKPADIECGPAWCPKRENVA